MGGNTTIITKEGDSISAQRIPLKSIGRDVFVKSFQKFLLNLNASFKKEFKYPIWSDESEIMNGGIFNGSTSFIMDSNYNSDEIEKYKPNAGDLDVAVPREYGADIYKFLENHEGTEFSDNIKYVGNNAKSHDKLGNTLICITKAKFGDIVVLAQLDLELSDFQEKNGTPLATQTDWSKFAHSSSFEDTKAGMKGVANKYFWRALVGALHQLESGFVVATPSSTPNKITLKGKQPRAIRLLNFGVDSGVGAGYEVMMGDDGPIKIDGNVVYREKKPNEKTYDKDLGNLMELVFKTRNIKPTDLHSFIRVLELSNKHLDIKTKQLSLDRFLDILFCLDGGQCQVIEPDAEEDVKIKAGMYNKAVDILNLKPDSNLETIIKNYVFKSHSIKERFRSFLVQEGIV